MNISLMLNEKLDGLISIYIQIRLREQISFVLWSLENSPAACSD